jgi:hypothetical protein
MDWAENTCPRVRSTIELSAENNDKGQYKQLESAKLKRRRWCCAAVYSRALCRTPDYQRSRSTVGYHVMDCCALVFLDGDTSMDHPGAAGAAVLAERHGGENPFPGASESAAPRGPPPRRPCVEFMPRVARPIHPDLTLILSLLTYSCGDGTDAMASAVVF